MSRSLVSALAGVLTLSALPAAGWAAGPKNVVFLAAPDTTGAKKLVERLEQAVRDDLIWIESYTIVARDVRGRLDVKEDWQRKPPAALPPGFGAGMIGLAAVLGAVAGLLVERGENAGIGFIAGSGAAPTRKPDWPGAPPVWPEDFIIGPDPAPGGGGGTGGTAVSAGDVLIVAALPDPAGADAGAETVTLLNVSGTAVTLNQWAIADAAGGREALQGQLAAGDAVRVKLSNGVQLSNRGDTLRLVDGGGAIIDQVAYQGTQVHTGRTITFPR